MVPDMYQMGRERFVLYFLMARPDIVPCAVMKTRGQGQVKKYSAEIPLLLARLVLQFRCRSRPLLFSSSLYREKVVIRLRYSQSSDKTKASSLI